MKMYKRDVFKEETVKVLNSRVRGTDILIEGLKEKYVCSEEVL